MLNFILEAKKNGFLLLIFQVQQVYKENKVLRENKVYKDLNGIQGIQGPQGATGETGNGISSIIKTSTSGLVDTYTITFTDGTTTTFDVTNGEDGEVTEEELDEVKELNTRLLANTPSSSTNTNPAYITECADLPLKSFSLEGKTEQESTNGYQLLNIEDGTYTSNEITAVVKNGEITLNGTTTTNWRAINIPFTFSFKAQAYTMSANNPVANSNVILRFDSNVSPFTLGDTNKTYTNTFAEITNVSYFIVRVEANTSLTNFKIKPMLEEGSTAHEWEPYTNGAAPNPNYPQEIRNVEGINLFNKNAVTTGKWLNTSGELETVSNYVVSDYIELTAGKTYYIPARATTRTKYYKADKTVYSNTWDGTDTAQAITIPSGVKYIRMSILVTGTSAIDLDTFQFAEGNTAQPYVPYSSIQIKKCNKNLLNSVTWIKTRSSGGYPLPNNDYSTIVSSNVNNIEFTVTNTYGGVESDFIPVKAGETYTISFTGTLPNRFFVTQYDKNKTRISTLNSSSTVSTTTVTTTNDGYIAMGFNNTTTSSSNFKINNIQIELGSTATTYVPHAEKTYNFPLSEGQVLMQDGTIENKIVNPRKHIDLSTLRWTKRNTNEQGISTYSSSINDRKLGNDLIPYSNKYTYLGTVIGYTQMYTKGIGVAFYHNSATPNNAIYLNSEQATVENLLTELNGAILEYELATPDETDFTEEQQAVYDEIIKDGTYDEVTHISATASINPDMEVGYYLDNTKQQESPMFFIEQDYTTMTLNHTAEEIYEAFSKGKLITAMGFTAFFKSYNNGVLQFSTYFGTFGQVITVQGNQITNVDQFTFVTQ